MSFLQVLMSSFSLFISLIMVLSYFYFVLIYDHYSRLRIWPFIVYVLPVSTFWHKRYYYFQLFLTSEVSLYNDDYYLTQTKYITFYLMHVQWVILPFRLYWTKCSIHSFWWHAVYEPTLYIEPFTDLHSHWLCIKCSSCYSIPISSLYIQLYGFYGISTE